MDIKLDHAGFQVRVFEGCSNRISVDLHAKHRETIIVPTYNHRDCLPSGNEPYVSFEMEARGMSWETVEGSPAVATLTQFLNMDQVDAQIEALLSVRELHRAAEKNPPAKTASVSA